MIVSFLVFSFLGAEEPQTPAQDQNNNSSEATAEAPAEAPAAEAAEAAPAAEPAQEAAAQENAPAEAAPETAEQPAAEEPKAEEPAAEEPAKTAPAAEDEQGYNLNLRALEEKIDTLKDKIFKSKQRLAILQETVLGGTVGGSTVTIVHNNEVGDLFKLVSAVYYFDDKPFSKRLTFRKSSRKRKFRLTMPLSFPDRTAFRFIWFISVKATVFSPI